MARDTILKLFVSVCQKPNFYVQCPRFSAVSAFIAGYDDALQGGVLVGFREWLLTRGNDWTNLPWWSLVRVRLNPEVNLAVAPSEEEETALIETLREALEGFSMTCSQGGLARVFHDHNAWLLSRSDPALKSLQDRLRAAPGSTSK